MKVYDLSVTDIVSGVIGRSVRLQCLSCQNNILDACTVIGRKRDEVHRETPTVGLILPRRNPFFPS